MTPAAQGEEALFQAAVGLIGPKRNAFLHKECGADTNLLAASCYKRLLSACNLGAPIYSTPVVANGVLYVQSTTYLYAIQDSGLAAISKRWSYSQGSDCLFCHGLLLVC